MGGCVCMCACAYAVLHGDCYSFLLTAHYYSPLTEKALKSDWAPFSKAEDWRPERVAVATVRGAHPPRRWCSCRSSRRKTC